MRNEKQFFQKVRDAFEAVSCRLRKLQDAFNSGLPDGYYSLSHSIPTDTGWIETKYVRHEDIPKKPTTPIKVELRPAQRRWLEEAAEDGIHAYCLLGVGHRWFLYRAPDIPLCGTIEELERPAIVHGTMEQLKWCVEAIEVGHYREMPTWVAGSRCEPEWMREVPVYEYPSRR